MSYGFGFGPGKSARRGAATGGTPAPLAVGAPAYDLADDFDTPAGNGSIAGRPGWDVPAGTFRQDTTVSGFGGDGVLYMQQEWTSRRALFGPAPDGFTGAHQLRVTARVGDNCVSTGTAWYYENHRIQLGYIDASNQNWLQLDPANNRIALYTQDASIDGGAETLRTQFASKLGLSIGSQPDLLIELTPASKVRVYVDKVPLIYAGNYSDALPGRDITGFIGEENRKGRTGFWANNFAYPLASFIGVRQQNAVFHDFGASDRGAGHIAFGGNSGQPRIEGDYFGGPVQWIFRLWHADDTDNCLTSLPGSNDEGWKAIAPTEITAPSGTVPGHVKLDPILPDGNWIVEYGFTLGDGGHVSTYAGAILIGRKVLFHGQSNARGRFTGATSGVTGGILSGIQAESYATPSGTGTDPAYPPGYVLHGADTLGYLGARTSWHFANTAVALSGDPCIVLCCGSDGSAIEYLSQGGLGWDLMLDFVDSYKGVVEDVYIDHGENSMWVTAATAAYTIPAWPTVVLNDMIGPMRALWGDQVRFHISIAGSFANTTLPGGPESWDVLNANVNALRLAQLSLCYGYGQTSDPLIRLGSWRTQIEHLGAEHHTGGTNGHPRLLERDAYSVEFARGNASHDGTGPRITGAELSGNELLVDIDLNGAAALTLSTVDIGGLTVPNRAGTVWGWRVTSDAAPGTPLTISAIDVVTGPRVKLTLSTAPGQACRVHHLDGAEWDDTNLIAGAYGAEPYNRPIPVQPSLDVANGRAYFLAEVV